jgi:signal transduction histidine kinase
VNGRRRRPRPTVRLRLTLLYGGLFILTGAVLLALNYLLIRRSLTIDPDALRRRIAQQIGHPLPSPSFIPFPGGGGGLPSGATFDQVRRELTAEALHQMVVQSLIALGAMAIASVALGYVVAGRALRPLKEIIGAARRISQENLHERIALSGPRDELKELADTFDAMLERLDAAFAAQRRFVANASHELRTPLTIVRAELDVTQADPQATVEDYRAMAGSIRYATAQSEKMIDSLLTLAHTDAPGAMEPLDLAVVTKQVLDDQVCSESPVRPTLRTELGSAPLLGDRVLLERMSANLLQNAFRYTPPAGSIDVNTGVAAGRSFLRVRNSGPPIAAEAVEELFEPFRRGPSARTGTGEGAGLGLSIVRSVAIAHGGQLSAAPGEDGGLDVLVDFITADGMI